MLTYCNRRRPQRTSDPTLEKDHERKNAEKIFLHFDNAAIDRIFTNSVSLTSVRPRTQCPYYYAD